MQSCRRLSSGCVALVIAIPGLAAGQHSAPAPSLAAASSQYFPPPESQGGWRSLLPSRGDPDIQLKARIRSVAGIDWDKLNTAWKYNAAAEGASALLVIRHGQIAGEWYKDCDSETTFNLYSCSKSYTSLAFGILLADHAGGKVPGGARLTLDTKVFTPEWLPEALPLSDPLKADITLRHLLTMTSGIGGEEPPAFAPFEWALGKIDGSAWSRLKGKPGTVFHYSNAGIAHLVLIFNHAAGKDLYPFLKERVFDRIGLDKIRWHQLGGDGEIGPFDQGYTGINTTPREHARFLYLALQHGRWAGHQVVPEAYYEFAWKGTEVNPQYGGLWWVYPHHPDAPRDLVQTAGFRQNHGYVIPSLDLVIVRVGNGFHYPRDFERDLVKRVLAAVSDPEP
jgi:CubicO group peptidase (beta-lactamase class C family)